MVVAVAGWEVVGRAVVVVAVVAVGRALVVFCYSSRIEMRLSWIKIPNALKWGHLRKIILLTFS